MLEQKDIKEAKKLFKERDNNKIWDSPTPAFLEHTKRKAKDSLALAIYLLEKLEQDPICSPKLNDRHLMVYYRKKLSYDSWEKEILERCKNLVEAEDISQKEAVLYCNSFGVGELIDVKPIQGSSYIYSMCSPFNEEMELEHARLMNWVNHFKLEYHEAHASGHASKEELAWVIDSIKPKIVIPNKTRTEKIGAIFIDWDNLVIPAENDRKLTYEEIFNLLIKTIVEQALKFIDVAHLFIYTSEAHIIINPFFEVYCEEMGFEPIFVPVAKDAADKEIVSKAEELASDQAISTFVFASGDGFFTNTVIKLKEIGKKVVIMPYDRFSLNSVYLWMLDTKKEIIFLKPLMTN